MHAVRIALVLLVVACHGGKDDTVDTDVDDTQVVDTQVVDTDTDLPLDTDTVDTVVVDTDAPDTVVPTSCKEASGVCTSGRLCPRGQGLPAFADDCVFDDGPGVCCKTPAPKPTGDGCVARGGVCAPIAGCGFVDGWRWITDGCTSQGGVGTVCCLPESTCGGPPQSECCNADHSTSFVTTCDRGVESCVQLPGTTMVPIGTCLTP